MARRVAARACERQPRRAQRGERVVGDLAGPDEIPQRLLHLLGLERDVGEQVGEEARGGEQAVAEEVVLGFRGRVRATRTRSAHPADRLGVVAEVQRDAAGRAAERAGSHPDDLARRAELIHPRRRVRAEAARQHVALPHLGGQREPLQRHEHLAQPVDPSARGRMAVDALPGGQERRQRALVGRLDLLAQRRERGAPQAPQDLGVTPLRLARTAAGPQLAANDLPVALQPLQDRSRIDLVARAQLVGRERPVRACIARCERRERIGHVGDERLGQPARRDRAERVAVQAGVVGGDPALLAADPQRDRAALGQERLDHRVGVDPGERRGRGSRSS